MNKNLKGFVYFSNDEDYGQNDYDDLNKNIGYEIFSMPEMGGEFVNTEILYILESILLALISNGIYDVLKKIILEAYKKVKDKKSRSNNKGINSLTVVIKKDNDNIEIKTTIPFNDEDKAKKIIDDFSELTYKIFSLEDKNNN